MKIDNPKNRNGCIGIRIPHISIPGEAPGTRGITKQNARQKVQERILSLKNKGIDFDYVVAYPEDGDPVLVVNKKFGNDWQEKGFFPELFQQTEEKA
jgi:hypothetical protein